MAARPPRPVRHLLVACTLLVAGLAAATAAGDTLVVGPDTDPLADHATLQAAHDAAAPGDVILVRPGSYDAGAIVSKPLTIVGSGAEVTTLSGLTLGPSIPFLPGGVGEIVLRGLRLQGYAPPMLAFRPGLTVVPGSYDVVVEECVVAGGAALGVGSSTGVRGVALVRCTIQGRHAVGGFFGPFDGGPGVSAVGDGAAANGVLLVDCDVTGGNGDSVFIGGNGGPGLLGAGRVQAFGCRFTGGPGFQLEPFPAASGSGVRLVASATFEHQDCEFTAGPPVGAIPAPAPLDAAPGAAVVPQPGAAATLAFARKTIVGHVATLGIEGAPGAAVFLLIGFPPPHLVDVPGALGALAAPAPAVIGGLPPLGPDGAWSVAVGIPPILAAGEETRAVILQALLVPPPGAAPVFTNPSIGLVAAPGA